MTIAQVLARAAHKIEEGRYRNIEGMPMARAMVESARSYSMYLLCYDFMCAFLGLSPLNKWGYPPERGTAETACWLSSAAEWAKVQRK